MQKIKTIFSSVNVDAEFVFNTHAKTDNKKQVLYLTEFDRLLDQIIPRIDSREKELLKSHFDVGKKGSVRKYDFMQIVNSDFEQRQTFTLSIEDVIKPLAT